MNSLPLSVRRNTGHLKSAKMSYSAFATWRASCDARTRSQIYFVKWSCTTRMTASGCAEFLYRFLVLTLKQLAWYNTCRWITNNGAQTVMQTIFKCCDICNVDALAMKWHLQRLLSMTGQQGWAPASSRMDDCCWMGNWAALFQRHTSQHCSQSHLQHKLSNTSAMIPQSFIVI